MCKTSQLVDVTVLLNNKLRRIQALRLSPLAVHFSNTGPGEVAKRQRDRPASSA